MLSDEAVHALAGERTPKFLATASASGIPNVVPVTSTMAADAQTLIFGVFMVQKTKRNLEENDRLSILVATEALDLWTIRGSFQGFETKGPYLDMLNENPFFKYNAYMGIRSAAVIKVLEVSPQEKLSKLSVAVSWLKVKALSRKVKGGNSAVFPLPVREKFSRILSARVFAFLDREGFPHVLFTPSLLPANASTLVFSADRSSKQLAALSLDAPVAASVITFDPIAYQAKGKWKGLVPCLGGRLATIAVTEIYSASPPRPGARIV